MLGTLFTRDFLDEGVKRTPEWRAIESGFAERKARLRALFESFPVAGHPNEAETEDRLVYPVSEELGWLRLVKTRTDDRQIPDALLYLSEDSRRAADGEREEVNRLHYASAILEAKKWGAPFDRRFDRDTPPMAQLMGYLSRAEVRSNRKVRWGVLTDGRKWRLSFMGAASLLTDFLEIDLAQALGFQGVDYDLLAPREEATQDHALKLFLLFFGADAFRSGADSRTFHERALSEGKDWEERVRKSLSDTIFGTVFPGLIRALKDADPHAPASLTPAYLGELREAGFTFLYRILFTLYAEDRDLLPKRYPDYDDYGLSKRVREDIEHRIERPDVFSLKRPDYYDICVKVFETIDEGDESVGVPPFNGGLFSKQRAPLLNRARIADRVFAPLFDALVRTPEKKRINYRDLSVRELGAVYEKLLEYEPVADPGAPSGIAIRLNAFARKGSGSYYTPDELVKLMIERAVGPLVREKLAAFRKASTGDAAKLDPASAILALKICDPAMGSGHFLVALVDYLADHVFAAIEGAREKLGDEYHSPVSQEAEAIRARIKLLAFERGWHIRDEMVDDRAIVRRMVLKRCVFGVDKNPQAVELAKVALWLHTLTAGAPLSFLDHHLKCGDSLFGEWVRPAMDAVATRGTLLINAAVQRAEGAAAGMAVIENLTDADMAEAERSRSAYDGIAEATNPLRRFLDFRHACKWLDLSDEERRAEQALFDGAFGDPFRVAAGLRAPDAPSEEAVQLFETGGGDQGSLLGDVKASVRDYVRVRELIARAHALAASERFLHWQIAFPLVWQDWASSERKGGFDAVIGNPPWDQLEFDEVKWFETRVPRLSTLNSDAKVNAINELKSGQLLADLEQAAAWSARYYRNGREARQVFSGRKLYLHLLFIEQTERLISKRGRWGLLVPTSAVSSAGSGAFVRMALQAQRLISVADFENRGAGEGLFFDDIDARTRFSVVVVGFRGEAPDGAAVSFRNHLPLSGGNESKISLSQISLISPGLGTIPEFLDSRDLPINIGCYSHPHLAPGTVSRSLSYSQMFNATSDRKLLLTSRQAQDAGAYPTHLGRMNSPAGGLLPVLEGKMVQAYNHRSSSIVLNMSNARRQAQPAPALLDELSDPSWTPIPQFWVGERSLLERNNAGWHLGLKDVSSATNERSSIMTIVPAVGCLHNLPIFDSADPLLLVMATANFNSFVFDYLLRVKLQGNHLTLGLINDTPQVLPEAYSPQYGPVTAAAIVRDHVLRLSYTAWDLEAFARDLGHVDAEDKVLSPFPWDEDERRHLRARLDALFFHLYGLNEADARYVLSTFPIVKRKDEEAHGIYLTEELVIFYMRALAAGDVTSLAPVARLVRQARAA